MAQDDVAAFGGLILALFNAHYFIGNGVTSFGRASAITSRLRIALAAVIITGPWRGANKRGNNASTSRADATEARLPSVSIADHLRILFSLSSRWTNCFQ